MYLNFKISSKFENLARKIFGRKEYHTQVTFSTVPKERTGDRPKMSFHSIPKDKISTHLVEKWMSYELYWNLTLLTLLTKSGGKQKIGSLYIYIKSHHIKFQLYCQAPAKAAQFQLFWLGLVLILFNPTTPQPPPPPHLGKSKPSWEV